VIHPSSGWALAAGWEGELPMRLVLVSAAFAAGPVGAGRSIDFVYQPGRMAGAAP
jgi:hypothetical protein